MAVKGYQNIVTDGIVLSVDAYNIKSYVNGNTDTYNLVSNNVSGGTLLNGVGYDENTWTFDGVSDYIDIGKDNLLRPSEAELNSTGFAVEAWFNLSSGGTFGGIFCNDGEGQSNYYGLQCNFNTSNQLIMHKMDGTGLGSTDRSSILTDNSYSLNKWYHVVFNYVSANKDDFKIYVNAEEQSAVASGTGGSVGYSPTLNGAIGKSRIYPFNGKISNVRVYNRKLLFQEVLQNYNATKWRFL
jgi:hypothetical protein